MKQYDVAAYIWPAYSNSEPRSRIFWEEGYGEWQTVKRAGQKFPGHQWPRKPLWGYVNEADPHIMEMEIDVAAEYGVNVFIYDWYWYDKRPFLENCLNEGYLKAKNNDKVKFYIMWANHDANYTWDIRNNEDQEQVVWEGAVDRQEFEVVANRLIEKYFRHPSYYKIDGKPVFMIYDLNNLIKGLGGVQKTREALDWFRGRCRECGLEGLHLQIAKWGNLKVNRSGVDSGVSETAVDLTDALGVDSMTHYQYCHFVDIDRPYRDVLPDVIDSWNSVKDEYSIPYFPHVSVGWDNNPRYRADILRPGVLTDNPPEQFEEACREARKFLDSAGGTPLVTINSWNEWTESSYLQPDDRYGYGYLEAIRKVFKEGK